MFKEVGILFKEVGLVAMPNGPRDKIVLGVPKQL